MPEIAKTYKCELRFSDSNQATIDLTTIMQINQSGSRHSWVVESGKTVWLEIKPHCSPSANRLPGVEPIGRALRRA